MEKDKEIIEDVTGEVIENGTADAALSADSADGKHVSADALFKSTQKDLRADAKTEHKKNLYASAKRGERKPREEAAAGELQSKLVCVNRITKVVKGGRTLRFNAVVVVGNKSGRVAVGSGKAREVTEAIKKAEQDAKKNLKNVVIVGTTIPHEVLGRFGTSKVKMIPTKEGNGIIAGGSVRAVLELAGYKDVTAKCYGNTNATNVVKATMEGLLQLRTREDIAAMRGKTAEEV
jgi:small subunit ribosomal protein S5